MPVECPSCGRPIAVKDAKPGRFRVPCPDCGQTFVIRVDIGAEPEVTTPEVPSGASTAAATDVWAQGVGLARRVGTALTDRLAWAWRAFLQRKAMLGGTLILEELGRTPLGLVARGRQFLIGRDVLLRVLPADWGGDGPMGRARANRLGQVSIGLVHPNLVRRFTLGEERGKRFAIEEALRGPLLADRGWTRGDAVIATVLHAARGLLAAHEQGVAHGDPSPEHLWLDRGGVVKLGGLGLYLPEEGRDGPEPFAASAARDVRALGQTLVTLASSRNEQEKERPSPARVIAARMKTAGTPEGYRDLSEAIAAMEGALGQTGGGPFLPRDDEARRLADLAAAYRDLPLVPLRARIILGFVAACVVFLLLFARAGSFGLAGGVLGLLLLTGLVYSLARAGLVKRPGLLGRVRELVLGGRRADWLTLLAVGVVGLVVLFELGWLAGWIALGVVATALAVGFLVAVDAPIERDRETPLEGVRDLLAAMRARGVAEPSLREFVRKHGGDRCDGLFEAIFGLEELGRARATYGRERAGGFRLGAWRFSAMQWLDARLRDRHESASRDRFERLEEAALVAQKVNEMTARRRSRRIAEALIVVGREVRDASLRAQTPDADAGTIRVTPRAIPDLIREAVETPDRLLTSTWSDDREPDRGPNPLLRLLAALTGPRVRFLLGLVLLGGFLLWADQVGIISSREIGDRAHRAIADRDVAQLQGVNVDLDRAAAADEPLVIPGVPPALTTLISGYGSGAAGLILLVSAFVAGSRIALFAFPAAAIAWLGPRLGIPPIAPLSAKGVGAAIGAGLLVIGIVVERRR